MNVLMIPMLAVKALRQNAMRSGLTMLGIVISDPPLTPLAVSTSASSKVWYR